MNLTTRSKLKGWPLAFLAVAALVLVYFLRDVLVPFVLAGGVAYILSPLIQRIHRRAAAPRWIIALAFWCVILAIAGGAGWLGWFKFHAHAGAFFVPDHLFRNAPIVKNKILALQQNFMAHDGAMKIARFALDLLFATVLFFVLLFYFLLRGPALLAGMLRLAPPEHRLAIAAFAMQIDPILGRYVRGLFVIVIFTSLISWIGVGPIFHLPYPILLAVISGLLELLPVIGPTASALLLGAVAILQGFTIWMLLGFALFCFIVRMLIDQIAAPIILGRAVTLPPVAIIFAFLAGGALFGLLGVLLAIPVLAIAKIALDNYYALPLE